MQEEVSANLQDAIDNLIPAALLQAMEKACLIVEADAKQKCPVDDGTLRQSITHEIEGDKTGCTGGMGTNMEYGPYVEKGTGLYNVDGQGRQNVPWKYQDVTGQWHSTKGMKPHPFLQPAVDDNKDKIVKQFEGIV